MLRVWPCARRNVVWVGTARDGADFAPKDIGSAAAFMQREAAEGKVGLF